MLAPFAAGMVRDAVARRDWPAAAGVVVSVGPTSSPSSGIVTYRYVADGREIEQREQRRRMDVITPGRAIAVRYHPADPTTSTTRPWFAESFSAGVGVTSVLLLWTFAAYVLRSGRARGPGT